MRTFWTPLLACFLCVCFAGPVAAQDEQMAKLAFEEGKDLFTEKKFEEAAGYFRKAYEYKKTWKLLFNIGQAEAAAKRYGLALEAFERYLAEGGDEVAFERREEIVGEIKSMREMVGDILVKGPPELVVYVDGVERGVTPMIAPAVVTSGTEHTLVVKSKSGDTLIDRQFRVRSGLTATVEIPQAEPMPAPAPEPTAQPEPVSGRAPTSQPSGEQEQGEGPEATTTDTGDEADPAKGKGLQTAGVIMSAVGGATLVGGLITGALVISKQKSLDSSCSGGVCTGTGTKEIEESRDSLALVTDILIPTGAAIAATGLILLIIHKVKSKGNEKTVSMVPMVSPFTGGISLEGRF